MLSDIEISQKANLKTIFEIGSSLGLEKELISYGKFIAKIPFSVLDNLDSRKAGKLVLVTAITPTPAGEGKTTTSVGLSLALNKLGRKSIVTLREPSLGPVFGVKGGAAGGGYSQVVPMEDINLHFTGDIHAVTSAHNLLSALIDNHLKSGNSLGLNSLSIYWPRVMDMNDRALRKIIVGLGGSANGIPREDNFIISVASEVMAILCLAKDITDLKKRLGKIIVGRTNDKKFATSSDLKANGAMAALLKNALNPNLVQTLENTPAFIHGGPFANIAHGTNSILATKMAMKLSEFTVIESGFAADLGAEKFLDFVSKVGEFWPDVSVLVATIRALKMHGGVLKKDLGSENLEAVHIGIGNLLVHIENLKKFNIPVVVALNEFPNDSRKEVDFVINHVQKAGATIALSQVWEKGSEGGIDLAKEIISASSMPKNPKRIYEWEEGIKEKIEKIATEIYRAGTIVYSEEAEKKIALFSKEFGNLPIIMAKTQASLTDDPKKTGAPLGYEFTIRDLSLSAGAGFIVAYAGEIMTMPGLPKEPSANNIDIDEKGNISGLF